MSAQLKMTEPLVVKPVDSDNRKAAMYWWSKISLGFKQDLVEQYHRSFPNYPKSYPMAANQIEYLYNNYRA